MPSRKRTIAAPDVIGRRLRESRLAKGLTQIEFCRLVSRGSREGLEQSDLSRFENGSRTPKLPMLERMAFHLDADPLDWLRP